jgi:hypothetical protein
MTEQRYNINDYINPNNPKYMNFEENPLDDEHKLEKNALGAIITQNVLKRMLSARDREELRPLGLLKGTMDEKGMIIDPQIVTELPSLSSHKRFNPFYNNQLNTLLQELSTSMQHTFLYHLNNEVTHLSGLPTDSRERQIYDRLMTLTDGHLNGIYRFEKGSIYRFIAEGTGTATMVLETTARSIDGFHHEQQGSHLSARNLAQAVNNSYPFIVKLASGHTDINIRILSDITDVQTGRFKNKYVDLSILDKDRGLRIDIPTDTWEALLRKAWSSFSADNPPLITTGCLALAKNDTGSNPIKDFIEFYCDALEQVNE